jgi:hypothetical protein
MYVLLLVILALLVAAMWEPKRKRTTEQQLHDLADQISDKARERRIGMSHSWECPDCNNGETGIFAAPPWCSIHGCQMERVPDYRCTVNGCMRTRPGFSHGAPPCPDHHIYMTKQTIKGV